MSISSEAVKRWRHTTKDTIIKALGGKCVICGYDKCREAIDLHHIDPTKKEFNFGEIMAHPTKWKKIADEAKKCVLLCANHHREFHSGLISLPVVLPVFDPKFDDTKTIAIQEPQSPCLICGKPKPTFQITCSQHCSHKRARKVDWSNIDLVELLKSYKSYRKVGEVLGVSGSAVKKRAVKLKII